MLFFFSRLVQLCLIYCKYKHPNSKLKSWSPKIHRYRLSSILSWSCERPQLQFMFPGFLEHFPLFPLQMNSYWIHTWSLTSRSLVNFQIMLLFVSYSKIFTQFNVHKRSVNLISTNKEKATLKSHHLTFVGECVLVHVWGKAVFFLQWFFGLTFPGFSWVFRPDLLITAA